MIIFCDSVTSDTDKLCIRYTILTDAYIIINYRPSLVSIIIIIIIRSLSSIVTRYARLDAQHGADSARGPLRL